MKHRRLYEILLEHILSIASDISPKSLVVRLPWPMRREDYNGDELEYINRIVEEFRSWFKIYRPQLQPGQDPSDAADSITMDDAGWTVGTIFLPSDKEHEELVRTHYAVYVPP